MKCEEYIELLNEYADGELTPDKSAQVEAHLAHCEKCRAYLDQLCALKLEMADMSVSVPRDLHDKIMQAVASGRSKKVVKIPFYRQKAFGWAIAACFMIAVLGVFVPKLENNFEKSETAMDASFYSEAAENSNKMSGAMDMPMEPSFSEPEAPGASMDISKEDIVDSPSFTKNGYIFKGTCTLPAEIETFSPHYGEGEIYIFCDDAEQVNKVIKWLSGTEFKQSTADVLSDKGMDIFDSNENVIIIVLK